MVVAWDQTHIPLGLPVYAVEQSSAGRDFVTTKKNSLIFCLSFFLSTVLAIAGEDFSIVASDTRLSEGFSIHTRDSPKCYKL